MLRFLLEKEFKQLMRNGFLPRLVVIFPFVILLLMPLAADFSVKGINLSVVDNDRSPYSRRLAEKAVFSGYFRLVSAPDSYRGAIRGVELGKADIILEIPPRFEASLVEEGSATVRIAADTVNGTKGGLGSAYLASIVADFSTEIRAELAPIPGAAPIPGFSVIPRYRFNPRLLYPVFMVPALMVMVLAMVCGFLPALNIVGEKESGTIEQINVTPIRRIDFILSKLIPYWVIGFVTLSICFIVARVFYGLAPSGSLGVIYLFALVFVLAMSGFGLVISNYAETVQQAMFMMFFFVITFIFISGLYTPVASMPGWAQDASRFSPLKYFILVMRQAYLKGAGFPDMIEAFLALCGFAAFFNTWAVLSYRKSS
ncbi:MAG: ABC transporter permease [Spirochaetes bacterium RIFOXYC1_FULL_54_7]|nr:MAG: ABC transporter permease [Spirochaetes bacterium RIFOXYC1_FULL_54_7]